jgi:long-chain acyl-CoA synthetase
MWDEKGRLKIVDRVKNLFKLSNGEYIAPEKLENIYTQSELVSQIFVYGDSLRAFIVAIVVPEPNAFHDWLKKLLESGLYKDVDFSELYRNEFVVAEFLKQVQRHGRKAGLKNFEIVRKITLTSEPFSAENGLFTPTMKLKRNEAKIYFQPLIDAMYGTTSD